MRTVILLLLITISGAAQHGVGTNYDKFKNQTTVSFGLEQPSLHVEFTYPGRDLSSNIGSFLFVFSERCRGGFCFTGDVSFIAIVDGGTPIKLGERRDVLSDEITFVVRREDVAALVAAKKVDVQIGTFEGTWREHPVIARLRALFDAGTAK